MPLYRKRIIFYSLFTLILGAITVFSLAYYQMRNIGELKVIAIKKLEELTRRKVEIGDAEMDIVRGLSIRLKDVSIKSRLAEEPELRARSVWVVVRLLPLLRKQVEVKKIIVQGASLRMVRDAKGRLSLGNVRQWITDPDKSGLFKVLRVSLMNQLMIESGTIHFQDYLNRSPDDPLLLSFKHIHFSIRKSFLKSPFNFNLKGEMPSEFFPTTFQVSGVFDNFYKDQKLTSIPIKGKLRVNGLNLASFRPYLKKMLNKVYLDSVFSLDTRFAGSLGGKMKTEGTLKYHRDSNKESETLRDARISNSGQLEYKVAIDHDNLDIENLKFTSEPFKYTLKGSIVNFLSRNPSISFDLDSDLFQVNKSIDKMPLNFFPEKHHTWIQSRFKNGSIKINSFKFSGSLNQLKELTKEKNIGLFSSEFEMKHVDWKSPLPKLKNVTGTFSVAKGDTTLHIAKAIYEGQPITNLNGTIAEIMTEPVVDLKVDNEVGMSQLHGTLKKILKKHPLFDSIAVYDEFEGAANVRLNLKGPLEHVDKLEISGEISLHDISLNEEGFEPRLKNLNGQITYTHKPEIAKSKEGPWIPIIRYKNLSGNFSKSSFSDMNGEIGFRNGEPIEKMSSTYKILSGDLPHVLSDNNQGLLSSLKKDLDFTSGEIIVNYRSEGNPTQPVTEKEWGRIELKNFSMKYPNRLQAMINLNGNISYGDGKIILKNLKGRYGDSPVQLEGEIYHENINTQESTLRIDSSGIIQSDLKDIPFFEDLKFSGPAKVSLRLNGNLDSFKFEQEIDMVAVEYRFPGFFEKQPNIGNEFKAKGSVLKNGGLTIDKWIYKLDGNQISGSARILNLDNPEFDINLEANNFYVKPTQRFFRFFNADIDGSADFKIVGSGNMNDIQEAKYAGEIELKKFKIRPENFLSFLEVDASLKFQENRLDILSANIDSDQNEFSFSGKYQRGDSPRLDLKLTGKRLDIDEVFPEPKSQEASFIDRLNQSEFFSKGKGRVRFNLDRLGYKLLKLDKVAGKIVLNNKEIELKDLTFASKRLVKSEGKMLVDSKGVGHFEAGIFAQDIETKNLFGFFGEVFDNSLSGKVKKINSKIRGSGKDWKEISRSLSGKISLDIQSGQINLDRLKRGVRKLFSSIPQTGPLEKDKPSTFRQISGDFVSKSGVLKTENFVFETKNRRTSIVGGFDLVNDQVDTVVGVAPMAQLDRFLAKIPLVGKIITGGDEKSLVKTYYLVKGNFNDPDISAIPFTSLGKKVMGIFQGILQTPKDILAPITDNLPNQKLSPSAVPESN